MKRILYFDCFSGISGDMTIGALIDLGVKPEQVIRELKKLGVEGYRLQVAATQKYGISGVDADVIIEKSGHEHSHSHSHEEHAHDHGHTQSHDDGEAHAHGHDHGRGFREIRSIIEKSAISDRAKELSIKIFRTIAEGEGRVHGKAADDVHFHEVGAVDSIVDVVGAAICIDLLEVDEVYCSTLREGTGFIECQHGLLPVPVPAVMEMLKGSGISLKQTDVETELVTPTGLGILRGLDARCALLPEMNVLAAGLGFGKRDIGRLNGLRVVLGEWEEGLKEECEKSPKGEFPVAEREQISVIETNLDDESGEVIGYTTELLLNAGALDVFCVPIHMKKGRPGVILSVLCQGKDVNLLSELIFRETSSLGVRITEAARIVLPRESHRVETAFGSVNIKVGRMGDLEKISPEYEDCARIAREQGIPLADVYDLTVEAWMSL